MNSNSTQTKIFKTTSQIFKLLVVGLILFSCNQKKESKTIVDEDGVKEITVDLKESKDISLSDFADKVRYIKLETNKESMFAGIYKVIITVKDIFILDQYSTKKVFHFSSEGKFINTIGKPGKGPEEYLQPRDFILDTIINTVEIIDGLNRERFVYSFTGEFLQRNKIKKIYIDRVLKLANGNYLVKLGNNLGPEYSKHLFAVLKPDLNTILKKFISPNYPSDFSTSMSISNPINNTVLFTYGFGDTIYQYRNDSVQAIYSVDFGKLRIPGKQRDKKEFTQIMPLLMRPDYDYVGFFYGLNWNQTHVFFDVLSKKKHYFICYNMQTKQSSLYSNIIGGKEEIYSRYPYTIYNGSLIFSLNGADISKRNRTNDSVQRQNYGVFTNFQEVQKNTYADDNPILVLMKPKNDI